jgi:hypothetical protein
MFKDARRHVSDPEARKDTAIADDGIEFPADLLPGAQLFLPEISLVAAIFEDAVRCVQRAHLGVRNREWLEAFEWIASERHDWPFAFVNVCEFLGVDPSGVRARLGVWPERSGASSHPSLRPSTHALPPLVLRFLLPGGVGRAQYESLARSSW